MCVLFGELIEFVYILYICIFFYDRYDEKNLYGIIYLI